MYICIAGKNECAINAIKILIRYKIKKKNICVLPNNADKGEDTWQPSLKKFASKNRFKIVSLKNLYKIKFRCFYFLC